MFGLEKLRKYLLVAGLLLTLFATAFSIDENAQLYFLIFIIVFTGVPHGSLDFFVERQALIEKQPLSIQKFLGKYLFSMLCYGLVWWLFPTLALVVFIGMAAYHFGEIDWPTRNMLKGEAVLFTVYGFLLIAFILTSHIQSAAPILELVVQKKFETTFWLKWGAVFFPYCCALLGLMLVSLFYLRSHLRWEKKLLHQFLLQSVVLIFIIYQLPLYLSFGFYFGLWHSLLSFQLIHKQMRLTNDLPGWILIAKKAIPFTAIAWMGIVVLVLASGMFQTEWLVLSNIFIAIAILTLPHLQVFTKIRIN